MPMQVNDAVQDIKLEQTPRTSRKKQEVPGKQACVEPGCKYVTASDKGLRCHMSLKHPKARKCRICDILVPSLKRLRDHMDRCHADDCRFTCDRCSYVGTNSHSLQNHKAQAHDGVKQHPKLLCRETDNSDGSGAPCSAAFKRASDLRIHLADHHGITAARHSVTEQFTSLDEFKRWKSTYEESSSATFICREGKLREGSSATYVCSRSGKYTPKVEGRKRQLKSQGSCKLGFSCTAAMQTKMAADGQVTVIVFPFHYGHGTDKADLLHLRLPAATRADAKGRLLKGESISSIIRDVRQTRVQAGDQDTSRGYRLTRRDLRNMSYSLGISDQHSAEAEEPSGAEQEPDLETSLVTPPSQQSHLVTPSASRPGDQGPGQRIVNRLEELTLMTKRMQETMSPETCQMIQSHLTKIEQILALESKNSSLEGTVILFASSDS